MESRAFVHAVVLLLGLTFTLTLLIVARGNALAAAQREFALESLGLQTRLTRDLSAVGDLLRMLARPPFDLSADSLPEPPELQRLMARQPFVEAIALMIGNRPTDDPASGTGRMVGIENVAGLQRPSLGFIELEATALATAIDIALTRDEVVPVVEDGALTLVHAACRADEADGTTCATPYVVAARLSREALLGGLHASALNLVVDVETEGLFGRRRLLDTRAPGTDVAGPFTARLVDEVRVVLPGYNLRAQLSRRVDVLRHGGGLMVTALLVGGGATLLLVALVRARSAQLQALSDRNAEISRQVETQTRELAATRDAALAAARAKAEFLATMSHEIRTPLNAIMGMSELLADSPLGLEQRQYVEVHRRASENLLALLNDVLDLSKAEAGQLRLAREPFDLRAVCEQSVDLFALRAAEKGLLVYLHLDPTLPARVLGDASRLRQVLTNLLGNAVKFTAHGEVALRVQRASGETHGERVHFQVHDTGIGVPSSQVDRIFEAFAQVDTTPRRRHGGTGLGLAICRELVQRMDGRLWLESEEGVGSTFHALVELPPDATTDADPAGDPDAGRSGPCAVVEPLPGLGAALADLARAAGHAPVVLFTSLAEPMIADLPSGGRLVCRASLLDAGREVMPAGARVLALVDDHRIGAALERLWRLGVEEYLVMPPRLAEFCQPRWVPDTVAAGTAASGPATRAEPDAPPERRLLLVDDSSDNRQLVRAFLRGQPWAITEAADGGEAVAAAALARYDLILMDIQMPGMDGYAAAQAIRRDEHSAGRPAVRMVALSAHTAQEDIDRALAAGCDAYLVKPLRKAALLEVLTPLV